MPKAAPRGRRRSSLSTGRPAIESLEARQMLAASTSSRRVVGYLPEYRYSSFSRVDLSALTHINYFSITATAAGALTTSGVDTTHLATVRNAAHAAGVTVSITIGPQTFGTMAASTTATAAFVTNIVSYVQTNHLDGIDIDWEPPATSTNKTNYGVLIDALYAKTHPLGLLLSAAVNPITTEIPAAAANKLDWLNVMGYDFAPANHSPYQTSVDSLPRWKNYGVAADKLVLGVPFYGRQGTTYNLTRGYATAIENYKTVNGAYPPAALDLIDGYYMNGVKTITDKAQYVINNNYGGIMIWELGFDHYNSAGKTDQYSLLPAIKQVIQPRQSTLIDSISTRPTASTSGYANESAPISVSVTARLSGAGVMQVSLLRADGSVAAQAYEVVSAATQTYDGGFVIRATETVAGTSAYTIAVRFRPNVTAGPLTGSLATDSLSTLAYSIVWQPARDNTAPSVIAKSFLFETGRAIKFVFDEALLQSNIAASDVAIRRTSDNLAITPSSFSYETAANSITFKLPANVPDGDYIATLGAGTVTDAASNTMTSAATVNFFAMAGDVNGDRIVNFDDLVIVAQNYGKGGQMFSQGNANYDASGLVNLDDLTLIAQQYNTSMAAAAVVANVEKPVATSKTKAPRVASLVI